MREHRESNLIAPWSRRESFAKLQERPLDCEERQRRGGVDAEFDTEQGRSRCKIDVLVAAPSTDRMDDEFLNQIGAVGDAGDERCAGNCDATTWKPRKLTPSSPRFWYARNARSMIPPKTIPHGMITLARGHRLAKRRRKGSAR